jgi:hypothetical protein
MKSYVILEVFRIEIEQIIFSRFRNGTKKNSGINFFSFPEVDKILWSGRFYRVGRKRGNKQYFLVPHVMTGDETKQDLLLLWDIYLWILQKHIMNLKIVLT